MSESITSSYSYGAAFSALAAPEMGESLAFRGGTAPVRRFGAAKAMRVGTHTAMQVGMHVASRAAPHVSVMQSAAAPGPTGGHVDVRG